jgi:hypothetical protein
LIKWCNWDETTKTCSTKPELITANKTDPAGISGCGISHGKKASSTTCFPASARVVTVHGEVSIDSLQRGDQLWSPVPETAKLAATNHMVDAHDSDPDQHTRLLHFLEISHELMPRDRPLLITPKHFLHKTSEKGELVLSRADDVHVGDWIFVVTGEQPFMKLEQSLVTNVASRQASGAFSPQTTSGRLIVNGVSVSSFAVTSEEVAMLHKAAPWATETLFQFMLFPTRLFYEMNLPFAGQVDLLGWLPKVQHGTIWPTMAAIGMFAVAMSKSATKC